MITKDNWQPIIDYVRKKAGKDKHGNDVPVWRCLSMYHFVCFDSLISPLAGYLYNLYCRIGGTSNETYESYHRLPPKYVAACAVIESEQQRIQEYGKQ